MEKTKNITLTIILSLATTITTIALWAGGLSKQQEINTENIKCLSVDLTKEISERKNTNTEILVTLAKIETDTSYIKEMVSSKE